MAGEIPIEIRCRGLDVGTLYAIVLGRTGVTLGLALCRGWNDVVDMIRGRLDVGQMSGFSVIFDELAIMVPVDLYLIDRNGWPIRTPEAYPAVIRYEPAAAGIRPAATNLPTSRACLRVVPDFVLGGQTAKTFAVVVNEKPIKLRLVWTSPNRPPTRHIMSRLPKIPQDFIRNPISERLEASVLDR